MKLFRWIASGLAASIITVLIVITTFSQLGQRRDHSRADAVRQNFLSTPIRPIVIVETYHEPQPPSTPNVTDKLDIDPDTVDQTDIEAVPPLTRIPVEFIQSTLDLQHEIQGSEYWGRWLELKVARIRRALSNDDYPSTLLLAYGHIELGDWDAARPLLWQLTDDDDEQMRATSALQLAFLEEDPRVVERLLYKACEANNLSHLALAVEFCHEAGSDDLKAYYVRRLFVKYPNEAAEFMTRFDEEIPE